MCLRFFLFWLCVLVVVVDDLCFVFDLSVCVRAWECVCCRCRVFGLRCLRL